MGAAIQATEEENERIDALSLEQLTCQDLGMTENLFELGKEVFQDFFSADADSGRCISHEAFTERAMVGFAEMKQRSEQGEDQRLDWMDERDFRNRLDRLLRIMDRNGDGEISPAEFICYFRRSGIRKTAREQRLHGSDNIMFLFDKMLRLGDD